MVRKEIEIQKKKKNKQSKTVWGTLDYKSEKWQKIRKQVLDRDHGKCRAIECNNIATVVHHAKYKGEFDEPLEWLFSLCEKCHNKFHKNTKGWQAKKLWYETLKLVGIIENTNKTENNIIKLPDDWRLTKKATRERTLYKRKRKSYKTSKTRPIKIHKKTKNKDKRRDGTPLGAEKLYEERRKKKREERLKNL